MAKPRTPKKTVKDTAETPATETAKDTAKETAKTTAKNRAENTARNTDAQIEDAVVVEDRAAAAGAGDRTDKDDRPEKTDPPAGTRQTPPDAASDPSPPDPSRPGPDQPPVGNPEPPEVSPRKPGRTGAMLALVLGGIVAGGIGFAAASYLNITRSVDPAAFQDALGARDRQITELTGEVDALKTRIGSFDQKLGALGDKNNEALIAQLDKLRAEADQKLTAIGERLAALENKTSAQIATGDAGRSNVQSEVDALKAAIAAQSAASQTLAAELAALKSQAQAAAAKEVASNKSTLARAALARIRAAMDSGAAFDQPLDELRRTAGVQIDADLARLAKTGVPSLLQLRQSFAPAARDALAAARAAAPADTVAGKLQNFIKGQLGVRSLEPKGGSGPDAVLSRAEAALGKGDVAGALNELQALAPAGRAKMAGWEDQAKTRVDALAAVDALSQAIK